MPDGTARTMKSQYYKNGFTNYFLTNCYGATGVLEIADKYDGRGMCFYDKDGIREARMPQRNDQGGGDSIRPRECWRYTKRIVPLNTNIDGCHKTIYSRMGRLGWENFLGRLEHGGWDCQMTSIMEIYEGCDTDTAGDQAGIH